MFIISYVSIFGHVAKKKTSNAVKKVNFSVNVKEEFIEFIY